MNIKSMQYIVLFLASSLCLSSCGFSPLYKKDNNSTYLVLANIELNPVDLIEGADFYNHLQNIIPHSTSTSATKYTLTTRLTFIKDISVIQKSSDIQRESVTIKVVYNLKDKHTGGLVTSGQFSRVSSFNTTFSPYSHNVHQQDVQKKLAIASAEEVRNRIMLFIENKRIR